MSEKRPDLHHSQPVRVSEILDAMTPEERAAFERKRADEEEQRASDKRVQDGTRDSWQHRLTLAIEKRLAEQLQLSGELVRELAAYRKLVNHDDKETRTLKTLKEIAGHVEEMRNNSRLTEGVLIAICESRDAMRETRDLTREVRDFLAESIQQTAQMQDYQLEAFRAMRDSLLAIALVVTTKGTNGHAPEGETT